ncbi:ribonuclease HII [Candidatus Saganbacteria bacterium]|nr:ribonuclease HII [Candidatus Saganbacteria bacterium]
MPSSKWENFLIKQGFQYIAGVDEVGRGPLAGPVVAAAVILPTKHKFKGINDSKKLKDSARQKLFIKIKKHAVAIGVGIVDEKTIDRINIAQASLLAMEYAVDSLIPKGEVLLVDGKCDIKSSIPQQHIVKGDSKCVSIAAASIIAKVIRDKIMGEYDILYPNYGFNKHKGYGTELHIKNILEFGPCAIHRRSFNPMASSTVSPNPLDFEQTSLIH